MLGRRLLKYVVALTTGLWLGGLTFYAAVVVPIGTAVVGGTEQGFITQQVTHWNNAVGILALIGLAAIGWTKRTSAVVVTWSVAAVLQVGLIVLHRVLDAQLDSTFHNVPDPASFYQWHRAYLIATAVMWLAALGHIWTAMGPNAGLPMSSARDG